MTDTATAPIKGASLFRPAALDRLSATEDMDRPAQLADGRHQWAVLAVAALLLLVSVTLLMAA